MRDMLSVHKLFLSIHDLTRRSTQEVTSNGRWRFFQFTTSQGGRLVSLPHLTPPLKLSIHDLTRRSTLFVFALI